MKIISGFFDRVLFAIGVLILLQLPNFIDQYTQRIGGYYTSELNHLKQYQTIANDNYSGDLNSLIADFKSNNSPTIRQTAGNIELTKNSVDELSKAINILENGTFLDKVVFLAPNINITIAEGTIKAFQPGIPLSYEAAICGLIGGIILSLLFNGIIKIFRFIFFGSRKREAFA